MKDKLIKALTIEYEAVYLINLEDDTFETYKVLKGSAAMKSSGHWSEAARAFVQECSEDSNDIVRLFADPKFLRISLAADDYQECTFRHITSDSRWRRACVQVIDRKKGVPVTVLMTVSMIDKLTYQKEKMLHQILSLKDKRWYDVNDNLSVYKMVLNEDTGDSKHKLFENLKILLVEDNEILRIISKELLENEGATVTEAQNGREAVDLVVATNKFDFIIMDIVMPVLDGIAATKEITEYQKDKETKIPILGLTADSTDEQIKAITEAGAYACLSKPLNSSEMSKVFISWMKEKSVIMEEKMAEINLLANTDMLTQAGNIVAYTHDIGELSRELYDNRFDVAIVICDLDNLKGINDNYGHDVGDIYIKNCCALIEDSFKGSPLYRVGGDEFALIVKGKNLSVIDEIMAAINNRSKILSSVKEVIDGKASVSAGYTVYDTSIDQSLNDTMKRADMAMYENKLMHKKWAQTYPRFAAR